MKIMRAEILSYRKIQSSLSSPTRKRETFSPDMPFAECLELLVPLDNQVKSNTIPLGSQ
jgi:hypothetical protein